MKIFISATNTDIGKTYTAIKIIKQLINDGYKVSAFKPIETGVKDVPQDASLLLKEIQTQKEMSKLTLQDITAYTFTLPSAPYIASQNTKIDINHIQNKLQKLEEISDIVVIESAGGLYTPIDDATYMIDLIELLEVDHILLVCDDKLGCINNALLSINTLNKQNTKFTWCINQKSKEFTKISKPFFDENFDTVHIVDDDIDKIAKEILDIRC